jgi:hypothetical protein
MTLFRDIIKKQNREAVDVLNHKVDVLKHRVGSFELDNEVLKMKVENMLETIEKDETSTTSDKCPICLQIYSSKKNSCFLHCGHFIHADCLVKYTMSNFCKNSKKGNQFHFTNQCGICRSPIAAPGV